MLLKLFDFALSLMFTLLPMPEPNPISLAHDLDPHVLRALDVCESTSLALVVAFAAINLAVSLFSGAAQVPLIGWPLMSTEACFVAFLCAISLYFVRVSGARFPDTAAMTLAAVVVVLETLAFARQGLMPSFRLHLSSGARLALMPSFISNISPQTAGGFALVGISILVLRVRKRLAVPIADFVVCCLVFLALSLVSGQIIDSLRIFGPSVDNGISVQSTICIALLTVVVVARKSRNGLFSMFAGRGAGSRLARRLSPFLIVLPYIRETMRAQLIDWRHMPPPYATAMLATMVVIASTSLLLYLAWRMNAMQVEIHSLSLRDELTGLYNLRGFRLLAEQARRMARRSGDPFSVLFIDLDNLKVINDRLGHQAGSDCLIEMAEILKSAFRETDVMGRIGGDEFAVAGEFNHSAIISAAKRLEELAALRSSDRSRALSIAFSVGHVTAEAENWESLDSLLAKADGAMYQEKRRRKELAETR